MGGSADTPATPEYLRASDAEREHAISALRNEFAEGRLSHETFIYRMQTALDARNRGQLEGLFADLPPRRPGLLDRIRHAMSHSGSRVIGRLPGRSGSGEARGTSAPVPFVFPPGSGVRFTIGRNRDCDLCLTDLSVSRRHAQLVRREDGWIVSDLGSHNGTRLNGWLIREPVRLTAGDRIDFGSVAFVIAGDPPLWPRENGGAADPPEAGSSA
jgi:hypothetical protein